MDQAIIALAFLSPTKKHWKICCFSAINAFKNNKLGAMLKIAQVITKSV